MDNGCYLQTKSEVITPRFTIISPTYKGLLLAEVNLDRYTREIPLLAHLVLKVAAVRVLDVLWQIHKERKLWCWRWKLRSILDADILALC